MKEAIEDSLPLALATVPPGIGLLPAPLLHTESFTVRSSEVDAWATLAVPALAAYFQEAALRHADELGCSIHALMDQGHTWVLVGEHISVLERIKRGDVLEVTTWPTGVDRLVLGRDFIAHRQDGVAVAQSSTRWLIINQRTRRPARPEKLLGDGLLALANTLVQITPPEVDIAAWPIEKRLPVRYEDMDLNAHANHTCYLAWALEALPEATWRTWRLASLAVQFLAECLHGGSVISRSAPTSEHEFTHSILSAADGRVLARLATTWVPREP